MRIINKLLSIITILILTLNKIKAYDGPAICPQNYYFPHICCCPQGTLAGWISQNQPWCSFPGMNRHFVQAQISTYPQSCPNYFVPSPNQNFYNFPQQQRSLSPYILPQQFSGQINPPLLPPPPQPLPYQLSPPQQLPYPQNPQGPLQLPIDNQPLSSPQIQLESSKNNQQKDNPPSNLLIKSSQLNDNQPIYNNNQQHLLQQQTQTKRTIKTLPINNESHGKIKQDQNQNPQQEKIIIEKWDDN
uniref:Candidate secreted effector n=1 Tax=Meloidogyne incognita TaxID=6306 RepID=A0A914N7T6_MELIC